MANVIVSPAAKADAASIWAYIAVDSEGAANRLLAKFDRIFQTLVANPEMGRPVPHLAPRLRCTPLGRYFVFYRIVENDIQIVRLLHGSRSITIELFRDLTGDL